MIPPMLLCSESFVPSPRTSTTQQRLHSLARRSRTNGMEKSLLVKKKLPQRSVVCCDNPNFSCTLFSPAVRDAAGGVDNNDNNNDNKIANAIEMTCSTATVGLPKRRRRHRHGSSSSSIFARMMTRSRSNWKQTLLKASNFASLLCVLDCTILPFLTLVLPLFGIVAASPAQMEWLHQAGHEVALYFVLPVGGLATTLHYYYYNHHNRWIAALGYTGLLAIALAHAGTCRCRTPDHSHSHQVHTLWRGLHHGMAHRVCNFIGCTLLLVSNWKSRQVAGCPDASCAAHQHHSHKHHHDPEE